MKKINAQDIPDVYGLMFNIHQRSGLTYTTVWRICTGKSKRIQVRTRQLFTEAARDLGYEVTGLE